MTLTPAYGRDYGSVKEVRQAFDAGKDFVVADMFSGWCGRYANKKNLVDAGCKSVNIRYKQLTRVAVINF